LDQGKDPELELERQAQAERAKSITLAEFYEEFMERHGRYRSKAMRESCKYSHASLCRYQPLAGCSIGVVTKVLIHEWMRARMAQDGVTAATVNREAAFVQVMVSKAATWGYIDTNPLFGLERFPEAGKLLNDLPAATAILDRFLHHAEVIEITGRSYRLAARGQSTNNAKDQAGKREKKR